MNIHVVDAGGAQYNYTNKTKEFYNEKMLAFCSNSRIFIFFKSTFFSLGVCRAVRVVDCRSEIVRETKRQQ